MMSMITYHVSTGAMGVRYLCLVYFLSVAASACVPSAPQSSFSCSISSGSRTGTSFTCEMRLRNSTESPCTAVDVAQYSVFISTSTYAGSTINTVHPGDDMRWSQTVPGSGDYVSQSRQLIRAGNVTWYMIGGNERFDVPGLQPVAVLPSMSLTCDGAVSDSLTVTAGTNVTCRVPSRSSRGLCTRVL